MLQGGVPRGCNRHPLRAASKGNALFCAHEGAKAQSAKRAQDRCETG
jgi:hypothetical protein